MSAPGVASHDGAGGHRCEGKEHVVFPGHPHSAAFVYAFVDVGGCPGEQKPGGDDEPYYARPSAYRPVPAYGAERQHGGGRYPDEENMLPGY